MADFIVRHDKASDLYGEREARDIKSSVHRKVTSQLVWLRLLLIKLASRQFVNKLKIALSLKHTMSVKLEAKKFCAQKSDTTILFWLY